MNYKEFERIACEWNGKTCIFGAGLIGRTWGFEIIKAAGFNVDYYADNAIGGNTVIRDNVKTIDVQELYRYGTDILILLTVCKDYQKDIVKQLYSYGNKNIICIDDMFGQVLYNSIETANDISVYERYRMFMDDEKYIIQRFEYLMSYKIDINNPRTYNEKINWLKINDRNPEYVKMVDKFLVKEYIASLIGEEYTIPTFGIFEKSEDINIDSLPNEFVIKTTNDSGGVYICKNKKREEIIRIISKLTQNILVDYYLPNREWAYKGVKHRYIIEKYLNDFMSEKDGILDYKIHCFMSEPTYIEVIGNRDFGNHSAKEVIYDINWQRQNWSFEDYPVFEDDIPRPRLLELMLEKSRILCKNCKYIRVDWYCNDESIVVGELTLYPNGGFCNHKGTWTKEKDMFLGNKIKLSER